MPGAKHRRASTAVNLDALRLVTYGEDTFWTEGEVILSCHKINYAYKLPFHIVSKDEKNPWFTRHANTSTSKP